MVCVVKDRGSRLMSVDFFPSFTGGPTVWVPSLLHDVVEFSGLGLRSGGPGVGRGGTDRDTGAPPL